MAHAPRTRPAFEALETAVDDRRAHVRYPCELDSSCRPISSDRSMLWTGKVRDVSCGGMGIVLGRRFELGTLLQIEVQEPDGTVSGQVLARVVHVTPHLGGWLIGCCFPHELSDDQVKALVRDPLD